MPRRGVRGRRRLRLRALLLCLCVCVGVAGLSACQAKIGVGVAVGADGSGSVTVSVHLDKDAAAAYAQYVRSADLTQAGWKVTGPTALAGGGVEFRASKPFANPAAAQAVVAELSGPSGPFHDMRITRHASLFRSRTAFQGSVDLTCGLNCFSDPGLQQALGGSGLDITTLQNDAGVSLAHLLQLEVSVRLPGQLQVANSPTRGGGEVVWSATLGQRASLFASSRAWNLTHVVAAVLIGLLVLAGVAAAAMGILRRRR